MQSRLSARIQTKIGPQLVIGSKLIRASSAEIELLVSRELAENPALELAHDSTSANSGRRESSPAEHRYPSIFTPAAGSWAGDNEDIAERAVACQSALDRLTAQLTLVIEGDDLEIAIGLLQSLDGHGYLRVTPDELAEELDVPPATIERLVQVLHDLEPPGIGARDLRQCLLIQCTHLEEEGYDCAVVCRILAEAWDDFVNQRWERVARKMQVSGDAVRAAWDFAVHNLYPYPLHLVEDGSDYDQTYSVPDLIVHRQTQGTEVKYSLEIPQSEQLELRVSEYFAVALRGENDLSTPDRDWISSHLERARLFTALLEGRWKTLRRIGEFLITYQRDFLEHGPMQLKPLTRAAVATHLDLHESTVSRAINGKILQLPDLRLMPLSDFFDHSLPLKESIRQVLAASGRRLSDREITEHLQERGLNIARRTVAKYRAQLSLPTSNDGQRDWPGSLARSA